VSGARVAAISLSSETPPTRPLSHPMSPPTR
jgi:hypothetical protein